MTEASINIPAHAYISAILHKPFHLLQRYQELFFAILQLFQQDVKDTGTVS